MLAPYIAYGTGISHAHCDALSKCFIGVTWNEKGLQLTK